jgi:hypothetical protein
VRTLGVAQTIREDLMIADTPSSPDAAPPPGAPPVGSRLWLYTNFDCNLACDYCCSQSSPRAPARRLPAEVARRACEEFAGLGGREILLDSGTPDLHDRHRGEGSFDRARAGIELLRSLGFRVRVAATVDDADAAEELSLHLLLDADGIPGEDRLIRRVARTGFADWGVELTIETLWPEPTLTADGAWWHPVGIADPLMQVASTPLPLITVIAVMRATLNDPERDRAAALNAFRCT